MSESLKLDPKNYRVHDARNKNIIKKSLEDCGAGRSIVADKDNVIIAGNGVYEQAKELGLPIRFIETDGKELVVVKRTDISSDDEKRKLLALADNHASDTSFFDMELVLEDFSSEDLDLWEFSLDDIEVETDEPKENRSGVLKGRFIIPPFSVLDSKQGVWQNRKNAWLDLGIKSELGRDTGLTYAISSQPPRVYEARNQLRDKIGRDPSWEELIEYCRKHDIKVMEGTSIFDPVVCELAYRWFNLPKGSILDPFAGGSVRGIVASQLGLTYRGCDLRKEQVEANYQNYDEIANRLSKDHVKPIWIADDSLNIKEHFGLLESDMIFSCPPYADLEVYSDDPRDLSNMDYDEFLSIYQKIIQRSCNLLKENRFAVFVVGDVRDKQGVIRNFVNDTIRAFQKAGLHYYNEMILVTSIGSLAIRVGKQFNVGRKVGKHHQNVLVFYKGNPKEVKNHFPELDFSENDVLEI